METFYCSNCGAPVERDLRFCRKCGHPVNISEATTRTLDPPPVIETATQHINSVPTGPSYLPPGVMQPVPAQTTRGLRPEGQNRTVIVLASLVGFLIIALVVLAIITSRISQDIGQPTTPPPQPPVASAPTAPVAPQAPLAPAPPPARPATTSVNSPISREMVYPGAEIRMEMNRAEGGSVLQLHTTDSYDKVVAWYTSKLRASKVIRTVGNTAILRGEGWSAVINGAGEGEGVNVLLKQELEKE